MKEDNSIFLKVDCVEPVLKGGEICSRETYLDGVKVWIGNYGYFFPCDQYTVCNPDEVRESSLQQAFALFKELYNMSPCDRQEVFGKITMLDLVSKNTYKNIVEKLDSWKKEKETIRVRDEVVKINNGTKFVVTDPPYMASNSHYYFSGIGKDGKVYRNEPVDRYEKTGVHISNLDEYLEV